MSFFDKIGDALKAVAPVVGGVLGRTYGGNIGAGIGTGLGALAAGKSGKEALVGGALGYGLSALTGQFLGSNSQVDAAGNEIVNDVPIQERSFNALESVSDEAYPVQVPINLSETNYVDAANSIGPIAAAPSTDTSFLGGLDWKKAGALGLGALSVLAPEEAISEDDLVDRSQPFNKNLPSNLTFGADQLDNYGKVPEQYNQQGLTQGYSFGVGRNPLAEASAAYKSLRG